MLAARLYAHGPPETIVLEEMPAPVPRAGEVLVGVRAASVNFPDVLIAANRYQVPVSVPFTPGSEFAGEVLEVGDGVTDLAPGARVRGSQMVGAFAEQVALPSDRLSPLPAAMNFLEGASFGVTGRTACAALVGVAEARPNEWVAVTGAAGGVGSAAVDVAARLGCRTLALASTEAKASACLDWGADAALLSGRADLKDAIRDTTGGGSDVVIDPVGGGLAEVALRAMRFGGRFVTVGYACGEIPRIPLNLVLLKGVQIRGLDIRTFADNAPHRAADAEAKLGQLVAEGLRPRISAVYPLRAVVAAMQAVASGQTMGKVVLAMEGDADTAPGRPRDGSR